MAPAWRCPYNGGTGGPGSIPIAVRAARIYDKPSSDASRAYQELSRGLRRTQLASGGVVPLARVHQRLPCDLVVAREVHQLAAEPLVPVLSLRPGVGRLLLLAPPAPP